MLATFAFDRRGNVGIIFGMSVLPLFGFAGAAVDYSRSADVRTFLHREADLAALSIVSADTPNAELVLQALKARALARHGQAGAANAVQNVTVTGSWSGSSNYTVRVGADLPTTLLGAVPFLPGRVAIQVETEATRVPARWNWSLPTISDLSYEAADYNRISVYCYDAAKKDKSNEGRRMKTLTAIADNGGTDYSKTKLPNCKEGETLSQQLRNVRNARTDPSKWDSASAEHYIYYTDTSADPNTRVLTSNVTGGRESSDGSMSLTDLSQAPLLETILCDTKAACRSRSEGGILPNNHETGRTPATATAGCLEGKYMYYGFEDRPPVSSDASDKDYDDIRIVVSCPTLQKITNKEVRIVR